jgi:hypothetical protein
MDANFSVGQRVRLLSSEGPIVRIVVRDLGEILLVCRDDELEKARDEGREPIAVGFKKRDLIGSD